MRQRRLLSSHNRLELLQQMLVVLRLQGSRRIVSVIGGWAERLTFELKGRGDWPNGNARISPQFESIPLERRARRIDKRAKLYCKIRDLIASSREIMTGANNQLAVILFAMHNFGTIFDSKMLRGK